MDMEAPFKIGMCGLCEGPAKSQCSACKMISYCSKEHQRQHWKIHKRTCFSEVSPKRLNAPSASSSNTDDAASSSFIISTDPVLGKQWVAGKKLKAGVIVLDEQCSSSSFFWDEAAGFQTPMCLACAAVGPAKRCSRCKWPVCGKECENASIHSENECKIFRVKRVPFPPPPAFDRLPFVYLLYFIRVTGLKKREPDVYEAILQLHDDPGNSVFSRNWSHIDDLITLLSTLTSFDELDVGEGELKKLFRISKINAFSSPIKKNSGKVTCLYLNSSRVNHSCVPNCSWEIGEAPDFKMRIRTTVDVKKGEPLTLCYIDAFRRYGTKQRQTFLQKNYGYACRCERCKDPTELGSFISALTCKACRPNGTLVNSGGEKTSDEGYMLPRDPIDLEASAEWECNGCQRVKRASELEPVVTELLVVTRGIEGRMKGMSYKEVFRFFADLIEIYRYKDVHPNHFTLQDISKRICTFYYSLPEYCFNLGTCQLFERHMRYLLGVQNKVTPGISPSRASLMRDIATIMDLQCEAFPMPTALKISKLKEIIRLREEVLLYYKDELPPPSKSISEDYTMLKQSIQMNRMELANYSFAEVRI